MRFQMRFPVAAALIAPLLLFAPAANAQTQSPSPGPSTQSPSSQSSNISEQKLDATAAALRRVASLQQTYEQQMAAAAPPEKARIASEASTALAQAVTEQGLSVDEYATILEVAQNNPEVREKIIQRLRPQ